MGINVIKRTSDEGESYSFILVYMVIHMTNQQDKFLKMWFGDCSWIFKIVGSNVFRKSNAQE